MIDAVVLGRIGYDLYSEEPNVPLPKVRRFSRYLGGSSANMAVGLARLGASVGIVSCLGNDSLSDFLRAFLAEENVDTSHVQTAPGFLPSLCLTEVTPPDCFPQVFYRHDAVDTRLDATEDDLAFVASSRMFITNGTALCASPSRESAFRAMERARAAGAQVVLDVDFRSMSWRSAADAGLAVRLALPFVDVLLGNQSEFKLVAGVDDLSAATEILIGSGVPLLVSKLGEEGTRAFTSEGQTYLAPYKVEVCTTIGAGDGFAAGFLRARLEGLPLLECLQWGNAAAAIVVSRLSCSEAMPRREEVETILRQQGKVQVSA